MTEENPFSRRMTLPSVVRQSIIYYPFETDSVGISRRPNSEEKLLLTQEILSRRMRQIACMLELVLGYAAIHLRRNKISRLIKLEEQKTTWVNRPTWGFMCPKLRGKAIRYLEQLDQYDLQIRVILENLFPAVRMYKCPDELLYPANRFEKIQIHSSLFYEHGNALEHDE